MPDSTIEALREQFFYSMGITSDTPISESDYALLMERWEQYLYYNRVQYPAPQPITPIPQAPIYSIPQAPITPIPQAPIYSIPRSPIFSIPQTPLSPIQYYGQPIDPGIGTVGPYSPPFAPYSPPLAPYSPPLAPYSPPYALPPAPAPSQPPVYVTPPTPGSVASPRAPVSSGMPPGPGWTLTHRGYKDAVMGADGKPYYRPDGRYPPGTAFLNHNQPPPRPQSPSTGVTNPGIFGQRRAQAAMEELRFSVGSFVTTSKGNREWMQTDNLTWEQAKTYVKSAFTLNALPYLKIYSPWKAINDLLPDKPPAEYNK